MNRKILSALIFVVTFIAAYLIVCFGIPGMRIKLEAEPIVIFFESITHMVLFKSVVSALVAIVFAIIPLIVGKKKDI